MNKVEVFKQVEEEIEELKKVEEILLGKGLSSFMDFANVY